MSAPIATGYTHDFVRSTLPDGAKDLLEVGCGSGELAARLAEDGLRLFALDSDEACVTEARAAGVDAGLATWPVALSSAFDTVLFTRSLHHIHPLDDAVAAAMAALNPGGRAIVEDFRAEGGGARGRAWFTDLVRRLHLNGAFRASFELEHTLGKVEFNHDEHELHSSTAIAAALARHGSVEASDAAYYFRYLEGEVRSPDTARAILDEELSLIDAGTIEALGRRFVVSAPA